MIFIKTVVNSLREQYCLHDTMPCSLVKVPDDTALLFIVTALKTSNRTSVNRLIIYLRLQTHKYMVVDTDMKMP
jgi:hypothetical protein